jgi:hypothetical protein
VPAFPIVKQFYVAENTDSGFIASFIVFKMNPLGLQRMKETFHRRIIPTVTLPAHAAYDPQFPQLLLISSGGILHALIRMQ